MTPNLQETKKAFDDAVEHIRVSYRFFANCVPRPEHFVHGGPVRIGEFEFTRPSQAESMAVELGWAFFTRLEAAFEALTLRLGLTTPKSVMDRLRQSGEFSQEELCGLETARELRNILHHGDGDPGLLKNAPSKVQLEVGREPHLDQEHMDRFVKLFTKAAKVLTQPPSRLV